MSADTSVAGRTVDRLAREHAERFGWYRDLLDQAAGAGLSHLPALDQATLLEHYYGGPELPGASTYLTSGTSGGERKRIQYCPGDDDHYVSQRRELFERFLGPAQAGDVAVSDLGTGHAAALARRIFAELGYQPEEIAFQAPIGEHVRALNEWDPRVLFTMPMILDQVLQAGAELTARPAKIIVVGDLAPRAWRANVAERFGIRPDDVLDVVGSIEIGAIAYSDARTGRYVFHDHIVAEVTDLVADGTPGPPCRAEGTGVLVLTSFTRDYFPAVRYVTGDLVSGLERTEVDGRTVYTCERFEGRVIGDFKHGERISSHDLSQAMAEVFPMRPFEVGDEGGRLRIRVVADKVTDVERKGLATAIGRIAPDVGAMTDSGLVAPVDVVAIGMADLLSGRAKRRFNLGTV